MTANTVYDVFMALPDTEKQRLIVLVDGYKGKQSKLSTKFKKPKRKNILTRDEAIEYLLKTVFIAKDKNHKSQL